MSHTIWTIAIAFVLVAQQVNAQERPCQTPEAAIAIRIYNYAQFAPALIAQAQDIVSRVFESIGVDIAWSATIDPGDLESPGIAIDPRERFVIIMTPEMARRASIRTDVAGVAATAPHGGGRIAFVLSDRVRQVAEASDRDEMEVMGLVMAHELGHLLLPYGSHSETGLMRPHWDVKDFRSHHSSPTFTTTQAASIRRTLAR